MPYRALLVVLSCLALCALAEAQGPELKLPDFSSLQEKATESVDVTLGSLPLEVASLVAGHGDADAADVARTLRGVRSVSVRHYAFAEDFAYPKADIDGVRAQLSAPEWRQLVHVRNRKSSEDVDVYMAVEGKKVTGLVVVASEPREFTIVHVIGSMDLEQVSRLRKRFAPHAEVGSDEEGSSAHL